MILTVTPNAALDTTYRVAGFVEGASLRVPRADVRAGGKGLNVARVLHQMGAEVLAVATAGGPAGEELVRDLEASGIPHALLRVSGGTRRSVAIVDTVRGETTVMNEVGEAVSDAECAALTDLVRQRAVEARCLTVSGSLPPGAPTELYAEIVRIGAEHAIPVVVDTVGEGLVAAARAGAAAVKPNRSELAETLGEDDPVAGARRLAELGAGSVLVSLGAEGILAVERGRPSRLVRARFPRVLAGNPTGAGDAAVAAVASCLAAGEQRIEAVVRRAVAWSAAAVLCPLAGELSGDVAGFEDQVDMAVTETDG